MNQVFEYKQPHLYGNRFPAACCCKAYQLSDQNCMAKIILLKRHRL